MTIQVCTVGHSNRSLEEFLALLGEHRIDFVIDVRRLPGSTKYPHFDAGALAAALGAHGIGYRRLEPLTGRRGKSTAVSDEVNAWWEVQSFHNFADHALTPEFDAALDEVCALARTRRVALMCAEAVWWRCHRRIIADHLLARGVAVCHVLAHGSFAQAQLSAGAVVTHANRVTYPTTSSSTYSVTTSVNSTG